MSPATTSAVVSLYVHARWRLLNWLEFRSISNVPVMAVVEMEASVLQTNVCAHMVSQALTAVSLVSSVEYRGQFAVTLVFVMSLEGVNAMPATEEARASFGRV